MLLREMASRWLIWHREGQFRFWCRTMASGLWIHTKNDSVPRRAKELGTKEKVTKISLLESWRQPNSLLSWAVRWGSLGSASSGTQAKYRLFTNVLLSVRGASTTRYSKSRSWLRVAIYTSTRKLSILKSRAVPAHFVLLFWWTMCHKNPEESKYHRTLLFYSSPHTIRASIKTHNGPHLLPWRSSGSLFSLTSGFPFAYSLRYQKIHLLGVC